MAESAPDSPGGPWEDPGAALAAGVTQAHVDTLMADGHVVIDNALPAGLAQAFRAEIAALHAAGLTTENKVQFATSAGPVQLTKPHIFESDLHDTAARAASPHFRRLFDSDALVARLNELAPALQLGLGSANRTIKLQHNTGGGAFPWHYDNPARPNKRRVTYLVYLNPDWKEGDGGEVALLPFLGKQVVVPPLFNRVVMFLSDRMLHRVLPASAPRFCFTIWIDSDEVNSDEDVFLKSKHLVESAIPLLQSTPLQRTLSRAVYREEYQASLEDCFGENRRDCKLALAMHASHLGQLLKSAAVAGFVDLLRARKP